MRVGNLATLQPFATMDHQLFAVRANASKTRMRELLECMRDAGGIDGTSRGFDASALVVDQIIRGWTEIAAELKARQAEKPDKPEKPEKQEEPPPSQEKRKRDVLDDDFDAPMRPKYARKSK